MLDRLRQAEIHTPVVMLTRLSAAGTRVRTRRAPPRRRAARRRIGKAGLAQTPEGAHLAAFGIAAAPSPRRDGAGREASDILLQGVRILLTEDNPINQQVATELLEALGVETTVAGSGEEALEILATRQFDLILMDMQMPGKDGLRPRSRSAPNSASPKRRSSR